MKYKLYSKIVGHSSVYSHKEIITIIDPNVITVLARSETVNEKGRRCHETEYYIVSQVPESKDKPTKDSNK